MHVAPRRVSGRGAGNPRGAPFGRVQKAKTNVFFVMLFVVCFVGSWHVCGDLSFRCLPQFVFVPRAPRRALPLSRFVSTLAPRLGVTGEGLGLPDGCV